MKHSTVAVTVNHAKLPNMKRRVMNVMLKFVTQFLASAIACTPIQLIVWKGQIMLLIAATHVWIALLLNVLPLSSM
jgi:hypothetical protein